MSKMLSFKGLVIALVSSVVVVGSLAGGSVALAANEAVVMGEPPGTPGPLQQVRVEALENFYQRAKLALESQQLRIDLGNDVAAAADAWITTLKGEGKDTSSLEGALADFRAKLSAAQSEHDLAAGIVNAHAGFDGNGKVTDVDQAGDTLRGAREHLRNAHLSLQDGTRTFRQTIRGFRQENRPEKTKEPPATEQP